MPWFSPQNQLLAVWYSRALGDTIGIATASLAFAIVHIMIKLT